MLCQHCNSELPETLTTRQHYQESDTCPEAIRHRIAQYDAIRHRLQGARLTRQEEQKKAELARQDAQKRIELEAEEQKKVELAEQEAQKEFAKRAEVEVIEAAKPTPTPVNIGIFDPTLIRDIEEFGLYNKVLGFLQHLQQIQHQYRESDVLALLPKCVRGPAFIWFNDQSSFTTIQDFGRGLACAFPTTSLEPITKPPTPPPTPPQYHLCVECSAQFSSMTRLLEHTKQANCSKVTCKHCEQGFNSKNKLHEHIRGQHTQKSDTNSNLRSPTPESTYKTEEKPAVICPLAPPAPPAPPTPPATPTSISEPVSPKCSDLPIATLNITSKSMEKLPANSLTPPASHPRTPVPKHQKSYLTIDDLVRMFDGKARPFGLRQHQKRLASPQSPGTRSPGQPRSPYQSRITAYFMPIANQKTPISQTSKSPNPKSFQQHTPAEPIRPASALPEKSAFSPYKKPGISYTSRQSRSSSRSSFAWPPPTSPPSFRSRTPDHVCCTCFGHFSFRNDPFNYPRSSQRNPSNRRFGAKLGGNGG